ncbi:MAG TPA: biotin/lipoyl-binding protein [Phycisphaerae bacterium]|nr:biotin/lipoyl-binding protein [Phycisphaerae bacterium]
MSRGIIILLIIVAIVAGGFVLITQTNIISMSNIWLDGKREAATRGDLIIPVTATGVVEAKQFIQIKCKASGIVEDIAVLEGQMVKQGDILCVLDPIDEKRQVEARQAEADRSKSVLEKTRVALKKTEADLPLQRKSSAERLKDAEASLTTAVYNFEKIEKMSDTITSEQERITVKATRDRAAAAVEMAKIELESAKSNEVLLLQSAQEDVVQAEAAYQSALKNLEDAKQRLAETTVRAPSDGMVYSIQTRQGEAIQSGTQSLTGGTPLMILADVSSMFVIAQIDEADIGEIRDIAPDYARPGKTQKLEESEYVQKAREVIDRAKAAGATLPAAEKEIILSEAQKLAIEKEGVKVNARPVTVTVDAYRTETYQGVIERILPAPERMTNAVTFKVRIRLVGDDLQKLNGLQADLEFETETKEDVVLVKNEALTSEGRLCYVYVPYRESAGDRWDEKKVSVKIGATDGTFTEVISGVNEGDEVWIKRPEFTDKEKKESGV